MYRVTLTYVLKKRVDDDAIKKVWSVIGLFSQSGQLVGRQWVTLGRSPFELHATGLAHERSALSRRFDDRLVKNARAEISPLLRRTVNVEWERFAEDIPTCKCRRPGGLIFTPDVLAEGSPFRCMDCRRRRPPYRLGRPVDYYHVRQLSERWIGFYWAWMDSGATEALAWRVLADPRSDFVRMSREQIGELETLLGIPVYYDLLTHYLSRLESAPEATRCPGCGRRWNQERMSNRLLCEPCRLFSYVPVDADPPSWWRPLPRHRRR
jgi:predicted  nucleic acid-binding Zn ribbon protein